MLQTAFKEWAVICPALAQGKQALILRKGGIAETSEDFQLEHTRFWLFPTYTHQQRDGIKPEAVPLLEEAERAKEPPTVYTSIKLIFTISGKVARKAAEDAVRLSEEKYCSVSAMLKSTARITTEVHFSGAAETAAPDSKK